MKIIFYCSMLAVAAFLLGCSRDKSVSLPKHINSVSAGYVYAAKLQKNIDPNSRLTAVLVDLSREGGDFVVTTISYGFDSVNPARAFVVSLDNLTHQAFIALETSAPSPFSETNLLLTIQTNFKDIRDILEISKTNGLAEFCSLTSPEGGKVSMNMFSNKTGSIWKVVGDGWANREPVADLTIVIDGLTGAVRERSFEKAVSK